MNKKRQIETFQLITHVYENNSPFDQAKKAIKGGCPWIQFRMKNHTEQAVFAEAEKIIALKQQSDFCLIINDHPELALQLGADGVHLGKNDLSPTEARTILGDDFIIGGTANTIEDIIRLTNEGVDYIGLGPFRFTATKENLSPVLGLKGYQRIMSDLKSQNNQIPIVAIGGIQQNDVNELLATGLYGIAVSSVINTANSIEIACAAFMDEVQKTKKKYSYENI